MKIVDIRWIQPLHTHHIYEQHTVNALPVGQPTKLQVLLEIEEFDPHNGSTVRREWHDVRTEVDS